MLNELSIYISILVDADDVIDLGPAYGAVLEPLTTLEASCVVLAGQVEGVTIVLAADDAKVIRGPLLHDLLLFLAGVRCGRTNLEDCILLERVVG
jgi:hypothetical protein